MYDITYRKSFELVNMWLKELRQKADSHVYTMLVGNKCDLEDHRDVLVAEAKAYAETYSMLFCETSAKDGTGVELAFHSLLTGQ